jgi:hypothetical protein
MAERRRRLVAKGRPQEFNLLEATAAARDVSTELEAAWSGDGGGDGGRALDDLLTGLGTAYIEGGRVIWQPPKSLASFFVAYLERSVEELNTRLGEGTLILDDDGNIKAPVRK